jgi:adenosine deaminase
MCQSQGLLSQIKVWDKASMSEALAAPLGPSLTGRFFAHFNTYLYRILSTPSSLSVATHSVLTEFQADGAVYLELRTTPRALPSTAHAQGLTAEGAVRLILSVIKDWNASSSPMHASLILTIDRIKHSPEQANEIVDLALRLRHEGLPVVGVDLAGDCNTPRDMAPLRPAYARARAEGLPITVHFAEVPNSASASELRELLSWNPRRLGHAIHVPEAMRRLIVDRGIAVELCLTCNVLAGMLPPQHEEHEPGFVDHHFAWWWAQDCSLSLGTDDMGVFGSPSSQEYRLAAEHFALSRTDLVSLCRRAMRGAFCGVETRQQVESAFAAFESREGFGASSAPF